MDRKIDGAVEIAVIRVAMGARNQALVMMGCTEREISNQEGCVMRIVAGILALVAIMIILWFLSLLVRADILARSEWGVEHQVQFSEAWRALLNATLQRLVDSIDAFLDRFKVSS